MKKAIKVKRYFDNYKDMRNFMERVGYDCVIDYGRKNVLDEVMFYVEYSLYV